MSQAILGKDLQNGCNCVNLIGEEFNWNRKDGPQMRTAGYNGLTGFYLYCTVYSLCIK